MVTKKAKTHLAGKKSTPKPHPQPSTGKDNRASEEKPNSKLLKAALIIAVAGILLFSVVLLSMNWPFQAQEVNLGTPQPPSQPPPSIQPTPTTSVVVRKAAFLDGLYGTSPNLTFTKNLINCLGKAGFRVDAFRGENVTINLLRSIGGYDLIILRIHSTVHTDNWLYLFSGEPYTESKYVVEQMSGAVRKGYTFDENETPYFALNAAFLGADKPSGLKGSVIILMGCNGTGDAYAIQRLFERGVKAFIAWNGYVNLSYSDDATLKIVEAQYVEKLSLKDAVEKVMKEAGPDPLYGSIMEYYSG